MTPPLAPKNQTKKSAVSVSGFCFFLLPYIFNSFFVCCWCSRLLLVVVVVVVGVVCVVVGVVVVVGNIVIGGVIIVHVIVVDVVIVVAVDIIVYDDDVVVCVGSGDVIGIGGVRGVICPRSLTISFPVPRVRGVVWF